MWSENEQRKDARYTYLVNAEYVLDPPATDEILQGAIVNLSSSGIGLFVSKPLDIGQEIKILSNLPNFAGTAVVRWIKQVGGCYKIGAECYAPDHMLSEQLPLV
ncbi:MAG: PilZ domain-containing protein [Nitrospirae bacterium]|nr:PilZ domain-containing protein [Nitrospirota bacterium]